MENTYYKLCPNVFLAKCDKKYEKGEVIELTTKYKKINRCIVFNLFAEKNNIFYYSIVREDGFNFQEYCKKKAEKYQKFSYSAINKSNEFYEKSNKDSSFLSLGEPIKIGHHSEKRHRKIIEQAQNNATKSIECLDKSEKYDYKAEYWQSKQQDINLSMPESLEYFEYKLEIANENHRKILTGEKERTHSFSLVYAKKECKELEKKIGIAKRLWS